MADEHPTSPPEDHQIAGHAIRITRTSGQERLLIDGRPIKFRKNADGYVLAVNIYAAPRPTLIDAVEEHLESNA